MSLLSGLGIVLSLVFGCLLLAIIAELYYLLWWKKQIITNNNNTIEQNYTNNNTKEIYLFCWSKPKNTIITTNPMINNDQNDIDLEESVESELIRVHNLAGPPRFLFTIKEETKEDLECMTSPQVKGTLNKLGHANYSNPLYETSIEAELFRLRCSPPPKFKFLRDAEEKLYKKLIEEARVGFNSRQHQKCPCGRDEFSSRQYQKCPCERIEFNSLQHQKCPCERDEFNSRQHQNCPCERIEYSSRHYQKCPCEMDEFNSRQHQKCPCERDEFNSRRCDVEEKLSKKVLEEGYAGFKSCQHQNCPCEKDEFNTRQHDIEEAHVVGFKSRQHQSSPCERGGFNSRQQQNCPCARDVKDNVNNKMLEEAHASEFNSRQYQNSPCEKDNECVGCPSQVLPLTSSRAHGSNRPSLH